MVDVVVRRHYCHPRTFEPDLKVACRARLRFPDSIHDRARGRHEKTRGARLQVRHRLAIDDVRDDDLVALLLRLRLARLAQVEQLNLLPVLLQDDAEIGERRVGAETETSTGEEVPMNFSGLPI